MKKNYQSWNININTFPGNGSLIEQLKFLINFAILAPSGHNSQPWKFSIQNNTISVWINRERALEQSDHEGRQLLISIGCAIENILTAADYYGFKGDVKYFPDSAVRDLVVQISFLRARKEFGGNNHLIFMIPQRHTNRGKYDQTAPAPEFLEKVKQFSDNGFQVNAVTDMDKEQKNAIADVALNAQIEAMDSDSFREELSHYIKSNYTKSKVGMPGFTLGIPAPVSLFASKLIKKINLSRKTKKKDENLLKRCTPAFIVISTTKDDRISWVQAGQLFERIWLMAEQNNLKCAPLAAPVQVKDYYKKVQNIFGIGFKPQVFFRLGYCSCVISHSPRFDVDDVLIKGKQI